MSELTVAVVAVFISVAVLSGSLMSAVVARRVPVRRRLAESVSTGSRTTLGDVHLDPGVDPAIQRLRTYVPKSPKNMGRLQRRLATAGFHGARPLIVYCVAELSLAALGFLVTVFVFGWRGLLFGLAGAAVGYMVPGLVLMRRVVLRKRQIQNGLPDALDLLIVSLEAGLGIDQAILKSAEELEIAYPALGEELRLVNIETRAGKPRLEAFKNFARRTQVDDVRALVAMLVQTDRFGTSVAQALRTHAEVSRTKRRQRAEEKAAKLGVKLVFPLVFCLLPAFFVVALGAAIIKFVEFFGSMNSGGLNIGGMP